MLTLVRKEKESVSGGRGACIESLANAFRFIAEPNAIAFIVHCQALILIKSIPKHERTDMPKCFLIFMYLLHISTNQA